MKKLIRYRDPGRTLLGASFTAAAAPNPLCRTRNCRVATTWRNHAGDMEEGKCGEVSVVMKKRANKEGKCGERHCVADQRS